MQTQPPYIAIVTHDLVSRIGIFSKIGAANSFPWADLNVTIGSGGTIVKTIRNMTHAPIRVPLPRGKVLHLGPDQKGQIAHTDVDHEPLQKLMSAGTIEVLDDRSGTESTHDNKPGAHAETHGHHSPSGPSGRGDR